MAANPVVAQSYADQYSLSELKAIRAQALESFSQGATVSRSYEGSSLTVDPKNAEMILENVSAAIDIKKALTQGCDAALEQGSQAYSISRRSFQIL